LAQLALEFFQSDRTLIEVLPHTHHAVDLSWFRLTLHKSLFIKSQFAEQIAIFKCSRRTAASTHTCDGYGCMGLYGELRGTNW